MKEYAEGEKAFFDGFRRSRCPYPILTLEGIRWNWGWLAAEQMEMAGIAPQNGQQGSPGNADNGEGR